MIGALMTRSLCSERALIGAMVFQPAYVIGNQKDAYLEDENVLSECGIVLSER
jgi:hypothetical protein